jgi:hypothetical protein
MVVAIQDELDWHRNIFAPDDLDLMRPPTISIAQKIDALCAYLGIEIVKEEKAEAIVARKIKRVKK